VINYVWYDGHDGFDRFYRIEGKKVDVYSFTLGFKIIY